MGADREPLTPTLSPPHRPGPQPAGASRMPSRAAVPLGSTSALPWRGGGVGWGQKPVPPEEEPVPAQPADPPGLHLAPTRWAASSGDGRTGPCSEPAGPVENSWEGAGCRLESDSAFRALSSGAAGDKGVSWLPGCLCPSHRREEPSRVLRPQKRTACHGFSVVSRRAHLTPRPGL